MLSNNDKDTKRWSTLLSTSEMQGDKKMASVVSFSTLVLHAGHDRSSMEFSSVAVVALILSGGTACVVGALLRQGAWKGAVPARLGQILACFSLSQQDVVVLTLTPLTMMKLALVVIVLLVCG